MKTNSIINLCLFLAAFWCLPLGILLAAEVDSVTTRGIVLDDSSRDLDALINQRIQEGVEKANQRRSNYQRLDSDEFCDEEILYDELRKTIFDSFTASLGLKGYGLDKQLREILKDKSYDLPLRQSVYRDINLEEGISLNLKELTSVARVNGYLIGFDKIGHFFGEGWEYFERAGLGNTTLDEAMSWGEARETGIFGYYTTGISSYADLVANFNGYRFWNRVLKKQGDPILPFYSDVLQRPYVRCKIKIIDSFKYQKIVREWIVDSRFYISEYIDGAWDEGINCNDYKTDLIAEKVQKRIEEVSPGFRCPIELQECIQAAKRYGKYSLRLLHPSCLNASAHLK